MSDQAAPDPDPDDSGIEDLLAAFPELDTSEDWRRIDHDRNRYPPDSDGYWGIALLISLAIAVISVVV